MRLKQIGARIIVAGIVLGVVGINVGHRVTWLYKFFPLGMFICFAIGAIGGVAGMIEDASKKTLQDFAHGFILPDSTVFTDEHPSYTGLEKSYIHHRIQHSAGVYVRGNVHTQTIEGFWSLVQNGIRGVYHSVSKKYLQTYLNEYAFRYNRRDSGNLIFYAILAKVAETASLKPFAPVA